MKNVLQNLEDTEPDLGTHGNVLNLLTKHCCGGFQITPGIPSGSLRISSALKSNQNMEIISDILKVSIRILTIPRSFNDLYLDLNEQHMLIRCFTKVTTIRTKSSSFVSTHQVRRFNTC